MDLNRSKYAEFYGDQPSAGQMIFYIAQISIFSNYIENHIFYIFCIFLKYGAVRWAPYDGCGDSRIRRFHTCARRGTDGTCWMHLVMHLVNGPVGIPRSAARDLGLREIHPENWEPGLTPFISDFDVNKKIHQRINKPIPKETGTQIRRKTSA